MRGRPAGSIFPQAVAGGPPSSPGSWQFPGPGRGTAPAPLALGVCPGGGCLEPSQIFHWSWGGLQGKPGGGAWKWADSQSGLRAHLPLLPVPPNSWALLSGVGSGHSSVHGLSFHAQLWPGHIWPVSSQYSVLACDTHMKGPSLQSPLSLAPGRAPRLGPADTELTVSPPGPSEHLEGGSVSQIATCREQVRLQSDHRALGTGQDRDTQARLCPACSGMGLRESGWGRQELAMDGRTHSCLWGLESPCHSHCAQDPSPGQQRPRPEEGHGPEKHHTHSGKPLAGPRWA